MFDEEDYYSDEEENALHSFKHTPSSKVLVPSSGSDFNHMTGGGESLLRIMKDRGFDLTDNEIKKMKQPQRRERSALKAKSKAGFFDGGDKASIQQLIKALNKSFSKADPQQASCILSYLLEKKNLSLEDRNRFSIMKCNILFGLGAYEDCLSRAEEFLLNPYNNLSAAIFSNLLAKCKGETNRVLSGYFDLLRAKSYINDYEEKIQEKKQQQKLEGDFTESQHDTTFREIKHTELEYNIKMSQYKNNTNLIFPFFNEFRHRKVIQVVCGDYHTLFLIGQSLKKGEQVRDGWKSEVFGVGENTVGQITGKQTKSFFKEPVVVSGLSGKGVKGIWACKESSLAYDIKGCIYEWGIKQRRNDEIEITGNLGEQILHLQKGYKHYAALTKTNKFYSWGKIQIKNSPLYSQTKPQLQDSKNIVRFSCGNSHTIALDSEGYAYALGNNDFGQLGLGGDRFSKVFKKVNNNMLMDLKKVFCLQDCTFFVNEECEVFFCGKHSHRKQTQDKVRQAEFGEELRDIVSISGSVGNYFVTNENGQLYRWEVDNMVKFKLDREEKTSQRYVTAAKANIYRVRSTINPEFCQVTRKTKELYTYESIKYNIVLKDQHGLFGVGDFVLPPKFQIFLSTYKMPDHEVLNQNKQFLESHEFSSDGTAMHINQIVETRLISFDLKRDKQKPWLCTLNIVVETSGKYFFYVIIEDHLFLKEELNIQVSEREKELSEKNRMEKQLKQEERRRKAELQKQRLADEKLRKQQQEEQKRKQTQKRAEEALKKHMREQEDAKIKLEEERKAKKELLTGGGYDLNKMKRKHSFEKLSEKGDRTSKGQSFLPEINQRPSSRKKMNLPKPSELMAMMHNEKPQKTLISQTNDFTSSVSAGFKTQKSNLEQSTNLLSSTNSTTFNKGGKVLMKRGISRKK